MDSQRAEVDVSICPNHQIWSKIEINSVINFEV